MRDAGSEGEPPSRLRERRGGQTHARRARGAGKRRSAGGGDWQPPAAGEAARRGILPAAAAAAAAAAASILAALRSGRRGSHPRAPRSDRHDSRPLRPNSATSPCGSSRRGAGVWWGGGRTRGCGAGGAGWPGPPPPRAAGAPWARCRAAPPPARPSVGPANPPPLPHAAPGIPSLSRAETFAAERGQALACQASAQPSGAPEVGGEGEGGTRLGLEQEHAVLEPRRRSRPAAERGGRLDLPLRRLPRPSHRLPLPATRRASRPRAGPSLARHAQPTTSPCGCACCGEVSG